MFAVVSPEGLLVLSLVAGVSLANKNNTNNWRNEFSLWNKAQLCCFKAIKDQFGSNPGLFEVNLIFNEEKTYLYWGVPLNYTTCDDFKYLAKRVTERANRDRFLQFNDQQAKIKIAVGNCLKCVKCAS